MTTVLRVFLKPAGQTFVDVPLADDQTTENVMSAWRNERVLYTPTAILPVDSWLYAVTFEFPVAPDPKLTVVPFNPFNPQPPKEPA